MLGYNIRYVRILVKHKLQYGSESMSDQSPESRRESSPSKPVLTREDWVAVARKIFIKEGVASLKVRPLSQALGVSTGAFYWQFKNLEEVRNALIEDWATSNTLPLAKAVEAAGPDGWDQYLAITLVFVREKEHDPAYDNAVRNWANTSLAIADKLREIDNYRIGLYKNIFSVMGYSDAEAIIRARVCYYHQVGYQVMHVQETTEERLANEPFYTEILTGRAQP